MVATALVGASEICTQIACSEMGSIFDKVNGPRTRTTFAKRGRLPNSDRSSLSTCHTENLRMISWSNAVVGRASVGCSFPQCSALIGGIRDGRNFSARAFTEEQESLVKEAWKELKKDAGRHSLNLFLKVFEIAPSTKRLFGFLQESNVPLEKNSKLKSHALKVFILVGEAASSLRNKGGVETPGSTLKDMASTHLKKHVVEEHYDVLKYCLMKTLEEGLPQGMWTKDMKGAWVEAYQALVLAMQVEGESQLRQQRDEVDAKI
eukprot:c22169_g1_i2 orf=271-1059(+)